MKVQIATFRFSNPVEVCSCSRMSAVAMALVTVVFPPPSVRGLENPLEYAGEEPERGDYRPLEVERRQLHERNHEQQDADGRHDRPEGRSGQVDPRATHPRRLRQRRTPRPLDLPERVPA